MFNWFKKSSLSKSDLVLQKIIAILYPPLDFNTDHNGYKYHVDYSADSNLEAALHDMEDGHCDEITCKTVRTVADKLYEIRKMLNVSYDMEKDAKYYIVDTEQSNVDSINAAE